jgi:hypothetical protein
MRLGLDLRVGVGQQVIKDLARHRHRAQLTPGMHIQRRLGQVRKAQPGSAQEDGDQHQQFDPAPAAKERLLCGNWKGISRGRVFSDIHQHLLRTPRQGFCSSGI